MQVFSPVITTQIFAQSRNPEGYFHPMHTFNPESRPHISLKSRPSNKANPGSRKTYWTPSDSISADILHKFDDA